MNPIDLINIHTASPDARRTLERAEYHRRLKELRRQVFETAWGITHLLQIQTSLPLRLLLHEEMGMTNEEALARWLMERQMGDPSFLEQPPRHLAKEFFQVLSDKMPELDPPSWL